LRRAAPIAAAAVIAFVTGCTNQLNTAIDAANAISMDAIDSERAVREVCEVVENEVGAEPHGPDQLLSLYAKCQRVWEAYDAFRERVLEFEAACKIQESDPSPEHLADVLKLLAQLVRDEAELAEAAAAITGALGGGDIN
jgi:hypothetical protein